MLQFLKIENLALLNRAELNFESGFHAVTGETGAGKSVLLGALGILAGQRVEKSVIKRGVDACHVEAIFLLSGDVLRDFDLWLDSAGLPACEEGALVLSRSVSRTRAPKIQINGKVATLAKLRELGGYWIDFHGPHEPQKLANPRFQLNMVDLFGSYKGELETYRSAYSTWRSVLLEYERIRDHDKLDADEIRFLEAQLSKADQLELGAEAISELEANYKRLSQAQEISSASTDVVEALAGFDGAISKLSDALRPAQELAELDEQNEALIDRMNGLIIELEDLSSEYRSLGSDAYFEESEAGELNQKMELWLGLKRKHGGDLEGVLSWRDGIREQLELQGNIDGRLLVLESQVAEAESAARIAADQLTQQRKRAAGRLQCEVIDVLHTLGFKKADLRIEIQPAQLSVTGSDHVGYLFSANPGTDVLPLGEIASSGEMARVMLAFKSILAQHDQTPVLVFDEVDANVGGEIGKAVGKRLYELSQGRQVFCITHLPQVAAMGSHHWRVQKDQSDAETTVIIDPLNADSEQRRSELARMMGDRDSETALKHAGELLSGC